MHMKTQRNILTLLGALLIAGVEPMSMAGSAEKNLPPADLGSDAIWTLPLAGGGVKTNDVYTDGNMFLTLPIWSTIGTNGKLGGSYLFIEPYTSVGDGGEVASSLGLAYRHLFSSESVSALQKKGMAGFMEEGWFLGGSLFVDMLDTQHRNSFWQLGVGAEIGNRYLELRGNYYIPLTGQKLADHRVSERSFTNTSTRYVNSGSGYGDPYATGNQIAQDVSLTTSAVTTYRTTTIRTVTDIFEKGMEGWDAELSVLIPWVDQWMDVRLIGGYFSFDNQPFGPQSFGTGNVHGWKGGVEVRPVPAVVLSGIWYEDKRLTGGNWTVGVQLQVPLDRTWKDAFKMRRRHLVEHLAEPVHRQNDAVKVGNTKEEESTSTTTVRRITRVVSQTQQHLVLADDIIFVNNGAAVGNGIQAGTPAGDGTAEKPVDTIQAGATLAGGNSNTTGRLWSAYVQGGASNYTGTVNVTGSTSFIGSGSGGGIIGSGGKMFGGTGPQPVLLGGITNVTSITGTSFDDIGSLIGTPVAFLGVRGFTINQGTAVDVGGESVAFGIAAGNVTTFVAKANNILNINTDPQSSNGLGIGVATDGSNTSTAFIQDNNVSSTLVGIGIAGAGSSSLIATLSGNMVTSSGTDGTSAGVGLFSQGTANVGGVIIGNTLDQLSGIGIGMEVRGGSRMTTQIIGNVVSNSGDSGIVLETVGTATLVSTVSGNTITNVGDKGLEAWSYDTSVLTATVAGNTFHDASGDYVYSASHDASALNLTTTGNLFQSALGDAIRSRSFDTSTSTLMVTGNTISNQVGNGISLYNYDGSIMNANLSGNAITNPGLFGIYAESMSGFVAPAMVLSISGNAISGTSSWGGIQIETFGIGVALNVIALDNNTITGTGHGGDGVFVRAQGGAVATVSSITGNVITNTSGNGLSLETNGPSTMTASSISGNTITNAAGNGMKLLSGTASMLNATISANTITGGAAEGIRAEANNTVAATGITFAATGNTINVADGRIGIMTMSWNSAFINASISQNTITGGTGGNGIYHALFAEGGANASTTTASDLNNVISGGNGFNGVSAQTNDLSSLTATFSGNAITAGNNSRGIGVSSGDSTSMNLTIGNNTVVLGSAANGIYLDHNGFSILGVSQGSPADNTVNIGSGLKLNSNSGVSGSIKINGAVFLLPASVP